MQFSILEILTIIGSLGFFLFGMKIMSEAIQKIAGSRIRSTLASLTSNQARGILSGLSITALIQSSSATTVLVVGFVNAGLLTLTESIGVIMGANVGTTITAWLVAIFGFSVNISKITLSIIGIGFVMTLSRRSKLKSWGEFLIGFSILFIGLNELKNAIPDLAQMPEVLSFLSRYADYGALSTLLFILIGLLFSALVQSSSAAMALTIVLASGGWIPFPLAAAMILGENIGTTITANLASLVGNVHAKRAAFSHFLFNLIGVFWMTVLLSFFLDLVGLLLGKFYGISSFDNLPPESTAIALALFHTVFNVMNTLILVWFIPSIAKLCERLLPGTGDETFRLQHIDAQVVPTSEIQIIEAKKEMMVSTRILAKMSRLLKQMIQDPKTSEWNENLVKIKKYEEITDRIEIEIANFLMRISESNISKKASEEIRTILRINSDLENIGDIYYKMSTLIQRAKESSIKFNSRQIENLQDIFRLTDQAQGIMEHNLMSENGQFNYEGAIQKEREIDAKRNEIRREHLKSIGEGEYNVQTGMFYNDLFTSCEEIGDYLFSISQAISDERKGISR